MTETFPGSSNGACRCMDPALWWPTRGDSVRVAMAVCRQCPVLAECREHGIQHEREGIWGATSGRERRAERQRRGIVIQTPNDAVGFTSWLAESKVAS